MCSQHVVQDLEGVGGLIARCSCAAPATLLLFSLLVLVGLVLVLELNGWGLCVAAHTCIQSWRSRWCSIRAASSSLMPKDAGTACWTCRTGSTTLTWVPTFCIVLKLLLFLLRRPELVQEQAGHLAADRGSDRVDTAARPRLAVELLVWVEDRGEERTGVALRGPLPATAVPTEAESAVGAALPKLPL